MAYLMDVFVLVLKIRSKLRSVEMKIVNNVLFFYTYTQIYFIKGNYKDLRMIGQCTARDKLVKEK